MFAHWFSFSKWISGDSKGRYLRIDIYATAWIALVVASAGVVHWRLIPWLPRSLITAALSYRLFDIFQSWVSQFILTEKWQPVNVNRSLVLVFVGYVEITAIGAVVRLTTHQFTSFGGALNQSVMTMVVNPQPEAGWPILFTQIMFAVLFATAVVQYVVGRLSN